MFLNDAIHHTEEGARIELGLGHDLRARNAESSLQVLFVSHEHINILHDAPDDFDGAILATRDLPEFLTKVQVKRHDCARSLCCLHRLDDQFRGCRR